MSTNEKPDKLSEIDQTLDELDRALERARMMQLEMNDLDQRATSTLQDVAEASEKPLELEN